MKGITLGRHSLRPPEPQGPWLVCARTDDEDEDGNRIKGPWDEPCVMRHCARCGTSVWAYAWMVETFGKSHRVTCRHCHRAAGGTVDLHPLQINRIQDAGDSLEDAYLDLKEERDWLEQDRRQQS